MMKLCVEIAFMPYTHIVNYIKLGRKYCPIFPIMQIIYGLKLYIMHISMFVYLPLTINEAFENSPEMPTTVPSPITE